jgi:hypothetical protein
VGGSVDVHQHLWPAALVEALRERSRAPRLDGWTLHLAGERPSDLDPAEHDVSRRLAAEPAGRRHLIGVSLSSPLGIEHLPADEAAPLLDAWHSGAAVLPRPFRPWVSASVAEPDLARTKDLLAGDVLGLQVPATALTTPAALERLAPLLAVCEDANRPVLVHPGPARPEPETLGHSTRASEPSGIPAWWAAVVDYSAQLQAAWWAWHVAGRSLLPRLRICFVAGAGLAPLQHERLAARGGAITRIDPDVFVETSSHGRQAIDALVRALGIDVIVLGSDRPWAEPFDPAPGLGAAAARAITCTNPTRLLEGGSP